MNEEQRYVEAERAAHWLTETLDDLNRQAAAYREMIDALRGSRESLHELGKSLEKTSSNLEELIARFETLQSGEFLDRVDGLSRSLSVAHTTLGESLNRVKSFTDRYEATYQSMQESSQAFLEEGKVLRGEIQALSESLPRENEKALSRLEERWKDDLSTLDGVFHGATASFGELFHSFEEKISAMQGFLDRFSPQVRETLESLERNIREAIQGMSERLEADRENLFARHVEENQQIVESTEEKIRSTGQELLKNLSDTTRRTREEWEVLLTERTEAVRAGFSVIQEEIEKVQMTLREENEKNLQEEKKLRGEIGQAVEQIGVSYQAMTGGLEDIRKQLSEMTDMTVDSFRVKLENSLRETEREWLTEIATIRDQEIEKLTTTKEEILTAVEKSHKVTNTNSLLLIATLCIAAATLIVTFWK